MSAASKSPSSTSAKNQPVQGVIQRVIVQRVALNATLMAIKTRHRKGHNSRINLLLTRKNHAVLLSNKSGYAPDKSPKNQASKNSELLQKPWMKNGKKPLSQQNKQQVEPTATKTVSAAVLKQHKLEEAKVQGENACRVCYRERAGCRGQNVPRSQYGGQICRCNEIFSRQ